LALGYRAFRALPTGASEPSQAPLASIAAKHPFILALAGLGFKEAAGLSPSNCGREPRAGELWRLYFADIGEVAIYCPACAEREFSDDERVSTS
jgi:hypothetical protein